MVLHIIVDKYLMNYLVNQQHLNYNTVILVIVYKE